MSKNKIIKEVTSTGLSGQQGVDSGPSAMMGGMGGFTFGGVPGFGKNPFENNRNDNHLVGIITDGDLRRHMHDHLLKKSAGEIMTTPFKTVSPDSLASEGLALMNNYAITHLFVVTNNKPIGILHVHDCLRAGIG